MRVRLTSPPAELRTRLLACRDGRDVARLLEIPYSILVYHARSSRAALRYETFQIPKRGGGFRQIAAPATAIKLLQRKLNEIFQAAYRPRPSAHGFLPERSILTNARAHCARSYVLNVDLEDFFGSINFGRVRGLLIARPYAIGADAATFIAQLCCHSNQLPQGAPTSPILANMVCAKLDGELQRLCRRLRCTYTRYADDITISTQLPSFPEALAAYTPTGVQIGPDLLRVIQQNGFRPHPRKVSLRQPSQRQEVTGLVVNKDPNVDRRFVRQIRAMLHAWTRHGLEAAEAEHLSKYRLRHRSPGRPPPSYARVLEGKLNFLRMVRGQRDRVYRRLARSHAQLLGRPTEFFEEARDGIAESLWVIECAENTCGQGTAFHLWGVGLVTCDHVVCDHLVAFSPGRLTTRHRVEVVARHEAIDLAILRLSGVALGDGGLRQGVSAALAVGDEVRVWGFPNFRPSDTPRVHRGHLSGHRTVSTVRRLMVDARIVAGNSGGPVLNHRNEVIGVAVTGAGRMEDAESTENHGVIPIEALERLQPPPV